MNKTKRLMKLIVRSQLEELMDSLHRQAVSAERCQELYERSIELQEQALRLQTKSTRAAQEMASISKQNYASRLLAATRAATMADSQP